MNSRAWRWFLLPSGVALALAHAGCSFTGLPPWPPEPVLAPGGGIETGLLPGVKASDGQLIVGLHAGHDVSELPAFGGQAVRVLGELRFSIPVLMLGLPAGVSVDLAIAELRTHPAVALIARNQLTTSVPKPTGFPAPFSTPIPAINAGPNDPMLGQQWGFDEAVTHPRSWWRRGIRGRGITVAVVDTGIDYTHPELYGRVLVGYNFKDGNTDVMDRDGHGTHVAGILGAAGNNGRGIAGVLWDVPLLAVKVMDGTGGTDFGAIAGIKYAVDAGAKVLNLSFSAPDGQRNPLFDLAIQYANDKGTLVFAATGNQGSAVSAPANSPGALAIAATSYRGGEARAGFSNYGKEVFASAPGDRILSTWPGGQYQVLSGTSMAAPMIAGAAAGLWAEHPDWSAAQVRSALLKALDALGPAGRNDLLGWGRIDFAKLP